MKKSDGAGKNFMRIAMLGWEFPPFVSGGLGTHCFELTRALCSQGVEVDFFMPVCGGKIEPHSEHLRIIEVAKTELRPYLFFSKSGQNATYGENLISAVNEYWEKCAQAVVRESGEHGKYDALHAHDWLTSRAGARLKEKLGMPLVQTFHSTEFDRTSWPWEFVVGVERSAADAADLIIAVSNRTKAQVLRLGADGGKIRVVYNGVDSEKFSQKISRQCDERSESHSNGKFATSAEDNKAIEAFKKKRKAVLFLGRLTEQKGPVQFLHAAKKVLTIEPDTLFVVAGKGELLPLLINMTLELGISQNVKFLGYVPDEEQQKIYRMADVYVMPSTSEPFGITALEAMSSGVPVIISRTSGVAEVVKTAIKIDFWDINAMAENIIAVLRYPVLSGTMSEMSKDESALHSWEKAADETLAVYREAVSKKK